MAFFGLVTLVKKDQCVFICTGPVFVEEEGSSAA